MIAAPQIDGKPVSTLACNVRVVDTGFDRNAWPEVRIEPSAVTVIVRGPSYGDRQNLLVVLDDLHVVRLEHPVAMTLRVPGHVHRVLVAWVVDDNVVSARTYCV